MRVAMLAPIAWRTPPRQYGPWEQVVANLTDGLVQLGIDVTLYATGDSGSRAKLRSVVGRGYEEDASYNVKVFEALHIARVFEEADQFDLIHNHFDFLPLMWSRLVTTPMVATIHGFSSTDILPAYRAYDDRVHYVAISEAGRHPDLTYAATIHHGIDLDAFPYRPDADLDGHVLFFGRIHPDKGAADAIDIARAAERPIVLAGIIQDQEYFESEVRPRLGADATYVGPVGGSDRALLLGSAAALLHPIAFEEPFGLSVIEAMACGTPVIAYRRGSMPELIHNGVNGFLVHGLDEAVAALGKLDELERKACRADAEDRFSSTRMVAAYATAYDHILRGM
jgi:glycosyltransferase involved in cell wall biosynthesis